jgi:GNAT superfamily N-acetyltransferase
VRFRQATLADVRALAAARWAFRLEGGETPVESEASFFVRYEEFVLKALNSGQWTYWVAEEAEGEIVAHMAVCVVESIPRPARLSDQWGYLTDCYTRPAARNRGVGRELLAHVTAWARARDLEMLIVWPSDASQSFYARAGFAKDDEMRTLHLRDYDDSPTES